MTDTRTPDRPDDAQRFTPDEIEDFWGTHAMDNPSCDTCRWLATITDLGAPGGLAAHPVPDSGLHTLLWPPHPGGVYLSSALCSCGEFQYDADTPGDLFAAMGDVRREYTAHLDAALATPEPTLDVATLADLLYRSGIPLPKGKDSRWYTEIAAKITALQEANHAD